MRAEGKGCSAAPVGSGLVDSVTGDEPVTWEVDDRTIGIRLRLARESSVPISPSM